MQEGGPFYEQLYRDAERRQEKQAALRAAMPQECTFTPRLLNPRRDMDDAVSVASSIAASERYPPPPPGGRRMVLLPSTQTVYMP